MPGLISSIWIIGLAVLLAGLGICEWIASSRQHSLRRVLAETPALQLGLAGGLALTSLGAGVLCTHWWERVLWGALAVLAVGDGWRSWWDCWRGRGALC